MIILFLLNGCVEREYFEDNSAGPTISGLFKEIQGSISGTLTYAESPYYVKDDIIIDSSTVLIIEPGVELYFDEGKSFIIKGKLKAIGQRYYRIYFLPYRSTWDGIKLLNTDSRADFQYCSFKKIYSDEVHLPGSILVYESEVEFKNCYFENNHAFAGGAILTMFSILSAKNTIFNSNFSVNNGGAISAEYSDITLINNTFNENKSGITGGALMVEYPFRTEVQNNIFYKNSVNDNISHITYLSSDTTNYIEQYNYIATGNMNPYFISENNFKLIYASPCKHAGNPSSEFNNIDGTRNDQGAYGGPYGNW
jgi:predicted outer membrane repeat protein